MKLKKHLSAMLAVVMLLSVFPCYIVAESGDLAKIEALKTAWSNLEEKVLEIVPGSGQGGNVTPVYALSADTSHLPQNAAETLNEFVGSKYAKATLTGSVLEADTVNAGTDYLKYGSSMVDISGCNLHFSFYMEELKGSFSFVPWFRRNYNGNLGVGNGTGKVYNVTQNDVGKWVTLSTAELTSDTYATAVVNLGNSLILRMTSSGENVVYFGSFIFTRKVTLPENSDNWGLAQWVTAAKALDISGYYNTDTFNEALSAAYTEDVKKTLAIQNAWLNMEKKITTLYASSTSISAHTGTTAFERYSTALYENLPAAAQSDIPFDYLGDNFNKVTFTSQENPLSAFVRYANTAEGVDIKDSNVYVSLFVNSTLGEGQTVTVLPVYRENLGGTDYTSSTYTKAYTVTQENTGKWITLNADDITPEGKMAISKIGNNLLMSVVSPIETEIIFGNFIFTEPATLPEDYISWSLEDAFAAAKALDLNGYVNTADMVAAINDADPQRKLIAERIKSAWSNLEEFVTEVTPMGATAAHKGATDLSVGSYTSSLGDPEIMGSATVTATFTEGTDSTAQSGPMSNYILYNVSNVNIEGCNVYLNFYMEEINGEFSFVPYYRESGGASGKDTGKLYTVSSYDSGHWVSLSKTEIANEQYFSQVSDLGNKIVLGVNTTETNTVTFGSFVFTKNVTLPEGSENWNYDQWVENANNLDISGYYNKSAFIEALEYANGGIYGEEITEGYSVKYGDFSSEMMESLGYNLISENTVYPAVRISGNSTASSGKREYLYDSDPSTGYSVANAHWHTGENENMYCDIYFKLDDVYLLNKLFVNHWHQQYLENGAYEIYVSEDFDDLFSAESLVFAYDNMSKSKNGTSYSQMVTFNTQNRPIGRYVSLRIKCSFSDWENASRLYNGLLYVRLSEFGVYGERVTQKRNNYRNLLDEKSSVFLYTMNYTDGTFKSLGDYENKDYSNKMLKYYMTDSNSHSVYDIYAAKQGESSIDIVINLGEDFVIDAVTLKGGSTEEYWPQEMKIYTGSTMEEVRSADSAANYTFAEKADNGVYTYETAPKSVRYIRYQITDAVNPDYTAHMIAVISELEIMGYAVSSGEELTGADYSDLNNDGSVNILDFVKMKKRLVQNSSYWIIADLNKDSTVSAEDLALLKKYLLGVIYKFT